MSDHLTRRPVPAVLPAGVAPAFPLGAEGESGGPATGGLTVWDSGYGPVNGHYSWTGINSQYGTAEYVRDSDPNNYRIGFNLGFWIIHGPSSLWLYTAEGGGVTPPTSGWSALNGTPPAPTLVFDD